MNLLNIIGRVRLNFAIPTTTNAEANTMAIKAETKMDDGNSGTTQTEDEVIFIIWMMLQPKLNQNCLEKMESLRTDLGCSFCSAIWTSRDSLREKRRAVFAWDHSSFADDLSIIEAIISFIRSAFTIAKPLSSSIMITLSLSFRSYFALAS